MTDQERRPPLDYATPRPRRPSAAWRASGRVSDRVGVGNAFLFLAFLLSDSLGFVLAGAVLNAPAVPFACALGSSSTPRRDEQLILCVTALLGPLIWGAIAARLTAWLGAEARPR